MGKLRKKHNWKARPSSEQQTGTASNPNVEVNLANLRDDKFDHSNVLVLPSKKGSTAKQVDGRVGKTTRKNLSRKERRRLEKLVESKKKKANRKGLLESLAKVQATEQELALMISTSQMQTKGLKRHFAEAKYPQVIAAQLDRKIKSVAGKNRKRIKIEEVIPDHSDSDTSSADSESDQEGNSAEVKDSEDLTQKVNVQDGHIEEKEVAEIEEGTKDESVKVFGENSVLGVKDEDTKSQTLPCTPTVFVPVQRSADIQKSRLKLPILAEEQSVMEAINENDVVVLCGETGSGKTTQVPQFLYEAGYAREKLIGVTEPRRVAAITMSRRVGEEMCLTSRRVSFQIRFEGNTTDETKIKFMTDGVLLKEIQNDFLLSRYSVIIIDEAHERSVYTDILIGLLSRIVPLRRKRQKPLKLIIMSATLRIEDFTENKRLFKVKPPVIKVESRQFPVAVHFNKRTTNDYVSEAYRKVCKIHRQLPEGGILLFVTGQQEVNVLCHKLRRTFPWRRNADGNRKDKCKDDATNSENDSQEEEEERMLGHFKRKKKQRKKKTEDANFVLPKINLDDYASVPLEEDDAKEQDEVSDIGDLNSEDDELAESTTGSCSQPMYVLPLYSLLSSEKQAKVFKPPPEGARLCVIATNVAETSLTIPNVKYVVDTGKVKTRVYDKVTGVSAFVVAWTSKAAANQRAGRAGRTGPGHCYRLYSSAVFNDEFEKFSVPEICRKPVDDLVLQMKDMNIDQVVNFPFPSAPDIEALKAAECRLRLLGALEEIPKPVQTKPRVKDEWGSKVTPLGHAMASFPVFPCYAKMLALSHQHNLMPFVITIVSALTVQEVLLDGPVVTPAVQEELSDKPKDWRIQWKQMRRTWAGEGNSLLLGDVMVLLKAVGAAEFAGCSSSFCLQHGLRYKAVTEVRKLRVQLTNAANLVLPSANLCVDPKMRPPSNLQVKLLRQIVLAGLPNHVARKIPESEIPADDKAKYKRAYKCTDIEDLVYIHPNSVLTKERPEFVVYQEIFETSKMFMRGISAIEPEWLPVFAPSMCTISKPLAEPAPSYDAETDQILCHVTSTFGPHCWALPVVEIEYPAGLDRVRWFAVFFLQGLITVKVKPLTKHYLSNPNIMLKSWAKLQPRTETLLQALLSESVDSRTKLLHVWRRYPKYLLSAYLQWLPESIHNEVEKMWPP